MGVLIYAQVILNLLPIRECKCCSKHKVDGVLCGTLIDCLGPSSWSVYVRARSTRKTLCYRITDQSTKQLKSAGDLHRSV